MSNTAQRDYSTELDTAINGGGPERVYATEAKMPVRNLEPVIEEVIKAMTILSAEEKREVFKCARNFFLDELDRDIQRTENEAKRLKEQHVILINN